MKGECVTKRDDFVCLYRLRALAHCFLDLPVGSVDRTKARGLTLLRFGSAKTCVRSRLLFFAHFLEARIVPKRIEHWIEPQQRRSERARRESASVRYRE
jgi:hypothetical protein